MELTGYGSDPAQQGDASIRFLGYCPQENVLWPSLTTRDHLEVFAAVKGLQRADARVAISRYCTPVRLLCAEAEKERGVGGHLRLPGAAGVERGWRPGAKPCIPAWGAFNSKRHRVVVSVQ